MPEGQDVGGLPCPICDGAPVPLWVSGPDGRCTRVNRAWTEFTGRDAENELGNGWLTGVHPDDLAACTRAIKRAIAHKAEFRLEHRLRDADGRYRWVLHAAMPRLEGGEFVGLVGSCVDITARRESEDRLASSLERQVELLHRERALLRELDHRVRNNMAGLLGLISMYERTGRPGEELAAALRGKIRAMNDVHGIISRSRNSSVGLGDLIERVAADAPEGAVVYEGPLVLVPGGQAAAMAIVLQELFTNSRKHGALSSEGGHVRVRWSVESEGEGRRLELLWSEQGRPAPASGRTGIGLKLIEGIAKSDLRGGFTAHIGAEGFSCVLRALFEDALAHAARYATTEPKPAEAGRAQRSPIDRAKRAG